MDNKFIPLKTFEKKLTVENASVTFIGHNIIKSYDEKLPVKLYHSHIYAELFYCKKGEITLTYNDIDVKLYEGDIVFVPPQITHFTKLSDTNSNYCLGILIKKKNNAESIDIFKIINKLFEADKPLLFKSFQPVSSEEMLWLDNIFTSKSVSYILSAFEVLVKLAEYINLNPMIENKEEYNRKKHNIIMQIENIIGGRYYENITANQLSKTLYISQRQLERIVKERYGASLHQIIVKKRMEAAALLLVESNLSVEKICSNVGFETKSCFYRAFKNEYGITPLQYRKNKTIHN